MRISFKPIWFDSLGAKSSCCLVETPDISIIIDPGAAIMQPSFPAPYVKKIYWLERAGIAIRKAVKKARVIVISHYHYDHFMEEESLYRGKILLTKNPNEYINCSQRERAEFFFNNLWEHFRGRTLEEVEEEEKEKEYPNPLDDLPIAGKKDFGDYNKRRKELLQKGLRWFKNRVKNWNSKKTIPELNSRELRVDFADGREFEFGKTRIRMTKPLFHGIEFSRVGWVISTIIEYGNEKFLHSSDLNGPIIEDYASWMIEENPDIMVLDGPATYMIPFMLNLINLRRCIENLCRIIEKTDTKLIILDHHLPRDKLYTKRLKKVYESAKKMKKKVMTAAEFLGERPKILQSFVS
jgi:hypothetical protein